MANSLRLSELEITGYATVLKETMLPAVVPPVFRLIGDAERAFLPPYSLNAGCLCDATVVGLAELETLRNYGELTLFDEVIPASQGFELWVDLDFAWHYEERVSVERTLQSIANRNIAYAEQALRSGELEEAKRHCGIALSANDRMIDPLAIKAALHAAKDDAAGLRMTQKLAAKMVSAGAFNTLVDKYIQMIAHPQASFEASVIQQGGALAGMAQLKA